MPGPVECEGAPRDLGRDQGLAARDGLRALVGEQGLLGRWRDHLQLGDPALRRWLRDVRRTFPHQHEWLEGVARAAGLPTRAVARAAIAALASESRARLVGIEGEEGAMLWRSAARDSVLRRVQPEGRFRSIELASPTLATPWIGVNESGLSLAVTGGHLPGPCAAHGALLARDCLERFESVESSLAWCLGRPAAPGAHILLADASGELAGVELLPAGGREVRRAESGVLVLGSGAAELAKSIADRGGERAAIASLLASELGGDREAASQVDVSSRSLSASFHASQSETASSGSSVTRQ